MPLPGLDEFKKGLKETAKGNPPPPSPYSGSQYPERQAGFGSDLYLVRPGESWSSIAGSIYGDERFAKDLQSSNPKLTTLSPGMRLVLPDRKENPQVPVSDSDFWNTPEFANEINAQEDVRKLISEYRQAEQIWPEHNDRVFIGFDEDNDPYPTTDPQGRPLYWDAATKQPTFEDTGIQYTMGQIENDFIKPLTKEEQIELTLLGERRFRSEALSYYAQAAESDEFKASIVEALPENAAWVPSLSGEPQAVPLELTWWESTIDAFSLGEEVFRGGYNVIGREAAEKPGLNMYELALKRGVSVIQTFGASLINRWTELRTLWATTFGQDGLKPWAIDTYTGERLTTTEEKTRVYQGEESSIRYMASVDSTQAQMDLAIGSTMRWFSTITDGNFTGVFPDNFESDEEYNAYLGGLYGLNDEDTPRAYVDSVNRRLELEERDSETRLEAAEQRDVLYESAFASVRSGDVPTALEDMKDALRLETRAAHWYSPFFMWSEATEPWRYDKFIDAVAIMTIENGEALDPRVIRDVRRRYEHAGVDIMYGAVNDLFNVVEVFKLGGLVLRQARKFAGVIAGLEITSKVADVRVLGDVVRGMDWMVAESHGSAGTQLKRMANNLFTSIAHSVDGSISQPGVYGLDEAVEQVFRTADPRLEPLFQGVPEGITELHLRNARRLANTFDEASELDIVQRIDPKRAGEWVSDAFDVVWNREYRRALQDVTSSNPAMSYSEVVANASRHADQIASKPKLVAREMGAFWEEAYRAIHQTKLGPTTLDDNFFIMLARQVGKEEAFQGAGIQWAFKGFYGLRNILFPMWLSLRPAWTIINVIDSTVRSLISGAGLFDEMGYLWRVNPKKLLNSRNLLQEEFTTAFSRGLREVDESTMRLEPAIDRILRGRKFKWGFLSFINDARNEALLERQLLREGRIPPNSISKVVGWMVDQAKVAGSMITRGFVDINSGVEFGLRERVFAKHFRKSFNAMDRYNLEQMLTRLTSQGADDDTISAFRKIWSMSDDDPDRFTDLVESVAGTRRGADSRTTSEILPDNFNELLDTHGVDRRLRPLVIRPVLDEVELIIRTVDDPIQAALEVDEYLDNVIDLINNEFVENAKRYASNFESVSDEVARVAREASTTVESGAEGVINIGRGSEEILEVTKEQRYIGNDGYYYLSEAYNTRGEVQQISSAQLGDARASLRQQSADGLITPERFSEADTYLSDIDTQVRLYRDRVKQFFLHMFPGPLKTSAGPARKAAWEAFDRLGVRVYDTVVSFTDEAVALVVSGAVGEVPTLRTMMEHSGIELKMIGQHIGSMRIADDVMGTVTSFGGWRSSNYWRTKLLEAMVGPNARLKDADIYFNQPYTRDISTLLSPLTAEQRAHELATEFGDAVGRATDEALANSDAAWKAVIKDEGVGGGMSLRRQWGTGATQTRQGFIDFINTEIERLVVMGVNDETISAVRQLADEAESIGITLGRLTDPMGVSQLPEMARIIPKWMLDDGLQTWLGMQRGLVAEHSGLVRFFEDWKGYLRKGLGSGDINLTRLNTDQVSQILDVSEEAIARKNTSALIASVGAPDVRAVDETLLAESRYGSNFSQTVEEFQGFVDEMAKAGTGDVAYKGGISITQDDMLEYAKNYRFDSMMKAVSPFWMFQSRSPLFWMKQYALHPTIPAWYSRYSRIQRKKQIDEGAVDSSGRPLNRFYGYFRVPGTDTWIAPLNPVSMRYVIPRPSPYPSDFGEDISPVDVAIQRLYEYGNMFGFRPAPWITAPLQWLSILDEHRLPSGSVVSQIDLIPPWIQRDIRRGLNLERYPNDPGLFSPDVSWKDFMIEKEMLGQAYKELQANPDDLPRIQAEMYAAMGYQGDDINEFGVAERYAPVGDLPYREHARWVAARDALEKGTYYNQLVGYFTGIYPKEMTDAEGELLAIRNEINFLKDSINGLTNAPVFGLDPVAESRYEIASNLQWETPEGFISQLYGTSRWTRLAGGGQAYGEDRRDIVAMRIWENEVNAAYNDSMSLLQDEFDACQKTIKVGSASALNRSCWGKMFEGRKFLDDNPVYDLARRDWAIGYKTEAMIKERFEHLWWSYVKSTRPKWFQEDGESYGSWQERTQEWKENLSDVAATLAPVFSVSEIGARTGVNEDDDPREIPGNRILVEEAVLSGLIAQTNEEGFDKYMKATDSPFDAMNAAWKELRWDPYMSFLDGVDTSNIFEKELAERGFMEKYGGPPSHDDLKRYIIENYEEGQFTPEQLDAVLEAGVETISDRQLPTTERGVIEDGVWEVLSGIGPGENFQIFKETFVGMGGDDDMFTAWYETNGHIGDFSKVEDFYTTLQAAQQASNFGIPSETQLVEFAAAKNMNDDFRQGVEQKFGEELWQVLSVYGVLKGNNKRDFKKANDEILQGYFDARDFFAEENQLWAKYYNPDEYITQIGIVGEGAERRGGGFSGAGDGGFGSRKSSFGRSGGGFPPSYAPDSSFIPQGYRSGYTGSQLADTTKLGSGGISGPLYWPVGFGKGAPPRILTEISKLIGDGEPLTPAAVAWFESDAKPEFQEYKDEILKQNKRLADKTPKKGGGGGVVKL